MHGRHVGSLVRLVRQLVSGLGRGHRLVGQVERVPQLRRQRALGGRHMITHGLRGSLGSSIGDGRVVRVQTLAKRLHALLQLAVRLTAPLVRVRHMASQLVQPVAHATQVVVQVRHVRVRRQLQPRLLRGRPAVRRLRRPQRRLQLRVHVARLGTVLVGQRQPARLLAHLLVHVLADLRVRRALQRGQALACRLQLLRSRVRGHVVQALLQVGAHGAQLGAGQVTHLVQPHLVRSQRLLLLPVLLVHGSALVHGAHQLLGLLRQRAGRIGRLGRLLHLQQRHRVRSLGRQPLPRRVHLVRTLTRKLLVHRVQPLLLAHDLVLQLADELKHSLRGTTHLDIVRHLHERGVQVLPGQRWHLGRGILVQVL
mmetsp:Transcript_28273/g.91473  ORF Transcript_28273/g.91473 Transcript_28273/m.91473 type:complete len:368 (+) Transcript_28273:2644-3747(+)